MTTAIEPVFRYEQISSKAYEHPADRAATSALRSIPLMDTVIKRLTDLTHERRLRQILTGNAVRVGVVEWVRAGDFDRIRSGHYVRRGTEPPTSAEFESAVAHYRERFSAMLERTAGGIQRLGAQLDAWLKGRSTPPDGDGSEGS